MNPKTQACTVCGDRYIAKDRRSKYCSHACRTKAYRIRHLDILKRNADPVHIWVELTDLGKRMQKLGLHVVEPVQGRKTEYYIVRSKKRKFLRKRTPDVVIKPAQRPTAEEIRYRLDQVEQRQIDRAAAVAADLHHVTGPTPYHQRAHSPSGPVPYRVKSPTELMRERKRSR